MCFLVTIITGKDKWYHLVDKKLSTKIVCVVHVNEGHFNNPLYLMIEIFDWDQFLI